MWTAKFAYPFFFHAEEKAWFLSLQSEKERGWFKSELDGTLHLWGREYNEK